MPYTALRKPDMKHSPILAIATALTLICSSASAEPQNPFLGAPKFAPPIFPGQLVVTFKSGTDVASTVAQVRASVDGITAQATQQMLHPWTVTYSISGAGDPDAQLPRDTLFSRTWRLYKAYRAHPNVLSAEPVYLLSPFREPNDPEYPRMWNYHPRTHTPGGANFAAAWDSTIGDHDIRIAVLDTGILPDEPEFRGSPNILSGVDLIAHPWMANDQDPGAAGDPVDYDTDPTDRGDGVHAGACPRGPDKPKPNSWHGSHVSGIAGAGRTNDGAGIAGAIWNVSIIPVRVLGRCGGTSIDIAAGIRWAAGHSIRGVPDNPHGPADIINLSFGLRTRCSEVPDTIQAAIDDALKAGSIVIAAAGNDRADAANYIPASCRNVITVAASDSDGKLATQYSNHGKRIDLMAPGGNGHKPSASNSDPKGILSVVKDRHKEDHGTSMSAPHVAAALALLLSQNSDIRSMKGPEKLRTVLDLLHASAVKRTAAQCPRPCGAGLLDAEALLTSARKSAALRKSP